MTTPDVQTDAWVPSLTFAARLALIRHQKGWNIKEAALACGISPQSWRGWELEHRLPHDQLAVADQITEATGVDRGWLLWGGPLTQEVRRRRGAVNGRYRRDRATGRPRSGLAAMSHHPNVTHIRQPATPAADTDPGQRRPALTSYACGQVTA